MKRITAYGLGALIVADLLLLVTGYRILIKEERGKEFTPYSTYSQMEKIGDTLSCTYWTGRSVQTAVASAYDPKPDECPFMAKLTDVL